ncbi:MAG: glycosyltransferase family 2 protein [Hyphomicrobiaceae bacterium]
MRADKTIGVVIPTLDEQNAIANVIGDIPSWVDRIVVADNGSKDRTVSIARGLGVTVAVEPDAGYGAACLAGIAAAGNVDVVVFLDGDYSDYPEQMDRLVDPIVKDCADLVIGSRVKGTADPGSLTFAQKFGNRLACFLLRRIWRAEFSDLGPFRAIRRTALERIDMQDRAFGWTVEMQIKATEHNLDVREVPIDYRPRIGTSKISGTIRGTVMAGSTILRVIGVSALRQFRS